jgi:uncharacterized protein
MFRTYILKLTGYCNLDCTYCYMFRGADVTFQRKPKEMSADTATKALRAIARECRRTGLTSCNIVLHGGEPTLWPIEGFQAFFDELERVRSGGLEVVCSVQTNLLRRPGAMLLELLRKHGATLGVSLDGPRKVNDAARVDFSGRGSYDRILRNVRSLINDGWGDLLAGFLSVTSPEVSPQDYLDWVQSLPVTRISLLWPLHYNADNPPWADVGEEAYAASPRYGAWLSELFELWLALDRAEIHIPLFERTVQARMGLIRLFDPLGALSFQSLVIDTDGAIELADYFRTSADGVIDTGYSVHADELAAVAADPRITAMREAADNAPLRCRGCEHMPVCQGGTLSGRLDREGRILAEPSVLCHDHFHFFETVARRVDPLLAVPEPPSEAQAPSGEAVPS